MAKKKTSDSQSNKSTSQSRTSSSTATPIVFPPIGSKSDLECHELLEDQIILMDNVLTVEECKRFISFIDKLPLELTPPKKKGEADRVNYTEEHNFIYMRISFNSPDFASTLHTVLGPHLPQFKAPARLGKKVAGTLRAPHSFNPNIRLYKYTTGQYFGPHYDDAVTDALTGAKSEWTLLVYLSGSEDGVEGGETLFHKEVRNKPRETIIPPLTRGMALLHRHGHECLLHEGSPVKQGIKYVLRSDLMFK